MKNNYKYFDIYVFYNRKDAYSTFVKYPTENEYVLEEDILDYALENSSLGEDDLNNVVYTREVDLEEYNQAMNIKKKDNE